MRHRLCAKVDVPATGIRGVQAPGYQPLAVCRAGESYYLIADTCTHGQASLSEGEVINGEVICPFHGGSFDVVTGEPREFPCTIPLETFPLIEEGDDLYVGSQA